MVELGEKFQNWKDFPKGLNVLVVDEDMRTLDDIKSKLERYHYNVATFSKGEQAMAALANQQYLFHLALIEAATTDSVNGFQLLKASSHLPTIMMSTLDDMAVMVTCITLGAVEFLKKPLTDEKLKNIWQHVVCKTLNAGDLFLPESLKPVKATVQSMLKACPEKSSENENLASGKQLIQVEEQKCDSGSFLQEYWSRELKACDRFPGPLMPQLEQAGGTSTQEDMVDECLESNSSMPVSSAKGEIVDMSSNEISTKVKKEQEHDCKVDSGLKNIQGLENGSHHITAIIDPSLCTDDARPEDFMNRNQELDKGINMNPLIISRLDGTYELRKEPLEYLNDHEILEYLNDNGSEVDEEETQLFPDFSKVEKDSARVDVNAETAASDQPFNERGEETDDSKRINSSNLGGTGSKNASGKKKIKIDWTLDLHRRFVQAVELLGVDQAIPSKILEVMKVKGLTRHNIASHLQEKYRSHKKHLLTREAETTSRHNSRPLYSNSLTRSGHDGSSWVSNLQCKPTQTKSHLTWIQPYPSVLPSIQLHTAVHGQPVGQPLHVWGHPTTDHSAIQMWEQSSVTLPTTWQASDGSVWQHPAASSAVWGHPTSSGVSCFAQPLMKLYVPPGPGLMVVGTPVLTGHGLIHSTSASDSMGVAMGNASCGKLNDFDPPKDILNAAINEVLNNPQTPLPIGLKPPSIESVMAELQWKGITTIPRAPM